MTMIPKFISNSIQNKVFFGFIAVMLLLAATLIVSFNVIDKLGRASQKILEMNYNSIVASVEMMEAMDTAHRLHLTSGAGESEKTSLHIALNNFSQWLGKAKLNITEEGETHILTSLDTLFADYSCLLSDNTPPRTGGSDIDQIEHLRGQIRNLCRELLEVNQHAMREKSTAAREIGTKGTITLALATLTVLILGLSLSWSLSRRISRPILDLKNATKRIAEGDYSVQLKAESSDELGILTREFEQMVRTLKEYRDLNLRTTQAQQHKSEVILSSIQDGIFFIDTAHIIREANTAALDALDLPRENAVGRHFLEVVKQESLFNDLKSCLDSRKTLLYEAHDNVLNIRKKDRQIYLEYFFAPVLDASNELLGVLFLLRDITNLKELDKLKSEFVMIVSHELKTPLTSINMSIDLLRESMGSNPKENDLELINIAKDEINRLRLLISDLLDLSKIEAGKIEMSFGATSPDKILESVAHYFRNQAADKGVTLEIKHLDSEAMIWCDEEKLMLVFSNLVSNALKAIKDHGLVSLSAEISGSSVIFCIKDTGIGIPLAYTNKIFDRFFQIEEQGAARGTGLGLTISREIVRAHGGSIWVESEPDSGSAFFFSIPLESPRLQKDK